MKKLLSILLVLAMLVSMVGCAISEDTSVGSNSSILNELNDPVELTTQDTTTSEEDVPDPDGSYTSKEDVALYIHLYGCLPSNFITKSEARELGWKSGSVEKYAPGKCIGGDRFGNYEGLLPKAAGRTYYECDIDTAAKAEARNGSFFQMTDWCITPQIIMPASHCFMERNKP